MPREPNEKSVEAKRLYESGMKLVDIAKKLDVPAGTVRRWKSTYLWDGDNSERSKKKSERSEKKKKASERKKEAVEKEVNQVLDNPDLTDKQRLFCLLYVKYRNKTKAYQKAFECSYECACGNASTLWKNIEIQKVIKLLLEQYRESVNLDIKDLFQWHLDIVRADIKDFVMFGNEDIEIADELLGRRKITISHVNIKNDSEVDGTLISEVSKGRDGIKVKLLDKSKSFQWLNDHIGLATEKQRAEIEQIKAHTDKLKGEDKGNEIVDDWISSIIGEPPEPEEGEEG